MLGPQGCLGDHVDPPPQPGLIRKDLMATAQVATPEERDVTARDKPVWTPVATGDETAKIARIPVTIRAVALLPCRSDTGDGDVEFGAEALFRENTVWLPEWLLAAFRPPSESPFDQRFRRSESGPYWT